jgi:diguanylate cyclase (GGDEF)-like protein
MAIFYIFLVAVLNLAVGFALAWHTGRRYREFVALPADGSAAPGGTVAEDATKPSPAASKPAPAASEEDPWTTEEDLDELLGGGIEVAGAEDTDRPAEDDQPADSSGGPGAVSEGLQTEVCLKELRDDTESYHQELNRVDNGLRACREADDTESIQDYLDALWDANEGYLESRPKVEQAFAEVQAGGDEYQAMLDGLEASIKQQDDQIRDTQDLLKNLDWEADPEDGCQRVIAETSKLVQVNHEVRDAVEEASVLAAQSQKRLDSLDEARRVDTLTKLASRAGLEATLAEWWEKDPHRSREVNVGMIDMDEFRRLNEQYGTEVCDRILRAVGQMITAECRSQHLAARYSGQRFVILFPDVDLRFTTNAVERIRQSIEMAKTEYREAEIRYTVSCAVTEARPDDTSKTLFSRAEVTLMEAKRYGRNRTFLHEGKYPNPVVPPNFTLEQRTITI